MLYHLVSIIPAFLNDMVFLNDLNQDQNTSNLLVMCYKPWGKDAFTSERKEKEEISK